MPRTPDQSASSALRTTSVYQRSKSTDILVTSLTKSCCSSGSCFMEVAPCLLGESRTRSRPRCQDGCGLARERGRRRGVLGRDRVDLGEKHVQQLFLRHGP